MAEGTVNGTGTPAVKPNQCSSDDATCWRDAMSAAESCSKETGSAKTVQCDTFCRGGMNSTCSYYCNVIEGKGSK